jgi:hypothetical protein
MNRYRPLEERPRRLTRPPVGRTSSMVILLLIALAATALTIGVFFIP